MANVKLPLEMAGGVMARNMDDLKANFDAEKLIEHYMSGKLQTWLKSRLYEEAEAVAALDRSDPELGKKLCGIFGEECADSVDTLSIARRLEKLTKLRRITDSDEILDNVDSVAFNQDELTELYGKGIEKIYLCEGSFFIPLSHQHIEYVEFGGAKVEREKHILKINLPQGDAYYRCPAEGNIYSDKNGKINVIASEKIKFSFLLGIDRNLQGDADAGNIVDISANMYLDDMGVTRYFYSEEDKSSLKFEYKFKSKTVSGIPPIKQICCVGDREYLLLAKNGAVFHVTINKTVNFSVSKPSLIKHPLVTGIAPLMPVPTFSTLYNKEDIEKIENLPPIKQVAGCGEKRYALDESGKIHIIVTHISELNFTPIQFFNNGNVQTLEWVNFPSFIQQLPPVKKLSCGNNATFALDENGNVYFWSDKPNDNSGGILNSLRLCGDGFIVDMGCPNISADKEAYGIPLLNSDGRVQCLGNEKYIQKCEPAYSKLPTMKRLYSKGNYLGTDENNFLYDSYGKSIFKGINEQPIQVYSEN